MQYTGNNSVITKFVSWKHFATLGVGQWVGDEIINHFVEKWCTQSRTTLGFSSFFLISFLFQDHGSCNTVCTIHQLAEDDALRYCLLRWVGKTQVSLLLFEVYVKSNIFAFREGKTLICLTKFLSLLMVTEIIGIQLVSTISGNVSTYMTVSKTCV